MIRLLPTADVASVGRPATRNRWWPRPTPTGPPTWPAGATSVLDPMPATGRDLETVITMPSERDAVLVTAVRPSAPEGIQRTGKATFPA